MRFTVNCVYVSLKSDSNSLSTGEVATITFVVTFIITLTATAVITFVMTFIFLKKKFGIEVKPNSELPQEKALYELVDSPNKTISKVDLELEPNPAYGTIRNVTMDTNAAYESCK